MITIDLEQCTGCGQCARIGHGYPATRFRNKVEGKRLPIQWNGD